MQSIPNLDVLDAVLGMMKETAIADQVIFIARDDCELRRSSSAIPPDDFFDESHCLFALGENAKRETHEVGICKQFRHKIDVVCAEWSQREAGRLQNRHCLE